MRARCVCGFVLLSSVVVSGLQGGAGAGRGQPPLGPNAITGRVTDESGKPVSDVFVSALRPLSSGDRPFALVSGQLHDLTNADGEYRLNGVPFEPLLVVALPHNRIRTPDGQLNRSGFANTFYPNATDVTGAKTVIVSPSGPARADIVLPPARLSVIAGTVIGSSGQAVSGGPLGVTHGDFLYGLDSRAINIQLDGRFAAPALPPGTYFLQYHESEWPPARGTIPVVSGAKVVVTVADVTGVTLVPIHMVTVSGRAVVDSALRASLAATPIEIGASPTNFDGNPGPTQPGSIGPELAFTFKNWPGPVRIRVFPENSWQIRSVRLHGVDMTGKPLDLIEGQDVSGLEVEIAKH